MNEFKYETTTYEIEDIHSGEVLRKDLEKRFNAGWKPTTNGPCLAIPLTSEHFLGPKRWLILYVFAKERAQPKVQHSHDS